MKTAMQDLIDAISSNGGPEVPFYVYELADALLEKEKKQIIDAHNLGLMTDKNAPDTPKGVTFSGENYYKNCYNK
jgi:hypothetical protein